ncbi:MAG: Blp family class II bacteriocin [Aerococcus sp.]|nr:Blp family class II bacteriocin [Aerococcus sp.]
MESVAIQFLSEKELKETMGGGCSWGGALNSAAGGAVGGAVTGAVGGTVTLPGVGSVAGWLGGGILGGVGNAAAYGATCWWNN